MSTEDAIKLARAEMDRLYRNDPLEAERIASVLRQQDQAKQPPPSPPSVRNDEPKAEQTPATIEITEEEANFITGILVKQPYEVAAPIIYILGSKLAQLKR